MAHVLLVPVMQVQLYVESRVARYGESVYLLLFDMLFLQARDPIPQFKEYMLKNGLATEDDIKAIHDRCAV